MNPHRFNRFKRFKRFTGFPSFANTIYSKLRGASLFFMRRTAPVEPVEPVEPIEPAPPSFIHNQWTLRPTG